FAPLAAEAYEVGSFELHITGMDIEQFLHASAGVEQHEQERAVANLIPGVVCDRVEHGADFIGLEIVNSADRAALGRHGQEALARLNVLRGSCRDEPRERMNGRQAGIPCGDAVVSVGFEMIEKGEDVFSAHVVESEIDDTAV